VRSAARLAFGHLRGSIAADDSGDAAHGSRSDSAKPATYNTCREDTRKLRMMDSAHRPSLTVLVFCNLRAAHVAGYSVP